MSLFKRARNLFRKTPTPVTVPDVRPAPTRYTFPVGIKFVPENVTPNPRLYNYSEPRLTCEAQLYRRETELQVVLTINDRTFRQVYAFTDHRTDDELVRATFARFFSLCDTEQRLLHRWYAEQPVDVPFDTAYHELRERLSDTNIWVRRMTVRYPDLFIFDEVSS